MHWLNQNTWMPVGSFIFSYVDNYTDIDGKVHKATVEELISHFKHETKLLKKLRKKVKNDIKYNYVDDLVYLCDSNLEIYLTLKYPEFIKTSGKYLYKVLKEHRIERILEYIKELRENKNFKKSNMENRINYINNL